MEKMIRPDHNISHLIISTHGNTIDEKGVKVTDLDLIGKIGPDKLDSEAVKFFKPLVGRFSRDAKVLFNSCSTFCGTDNEVKARAQTFMNALKIPD